MICVGFTSTSCYPASSRTVCRPAGFFVLILILFLDAAKPHLCAFSRGQRKTRRCVLFLSLASDTAQDSHVGHRSPWNCNVQTNQLLLTEGMFCSRCSWLPIPCPSVKLEIPSPAQASICLTSYQEFLESVPPVTQAVEAFFLIWPQAVSGWESFPFLLCYLWWHITEDNEQRGEPEFRKEREPGEGVEALTSDPWEA